MRYFDLWRIKLENVAPWTIPYVRGIHILPKPLTRQRKRIIDKRQKGRKEDRRGAVEWGATDVFSL